MEFYGAERSRKALRAKTAEGSGAARAQTEGHRRRPRSLTDLVTSAEMMSVTVLLSSVSSSSIGPGMGSCCLRCSALRICCRFCQIISASFSHLAGRKRTRVRHVDALHSNTFLRPTRSCVVQPSQPRGPEGGVCAF